MYLMYEGKNPKIINNSNKINSFLKIRSKIII